MVSVIDLVDLRGPRGYGVSQSVVDANGDLILTFTDGTVANAGYVRGGQGLPGTNANTGDVATAGWVAGPSVTQAALDAAYAPFLEGVLYGTKNGVIPGTGANQTPALQALLNTASAAGKAVFLPRGVYTLATTLAIPSNTHLYGQKGTVLKIANAFPSGTCIGNAVSSGFQNIYIHDIEIDGNAAGQTGDQTINGTPNVTLFMSSAQATPGKNVVLERIYQHDAYRLGLSAQNIEGLTVIDCRVEDNGRDGITIYDKCKNVIVAGNRISRCNDDHIALNSENGPGWMENVTVYGNVIQGPGARGVGKGIRVLGGRNISLTGNTIDGMSEVGIYVCNKDTMGLRALTISGNTIRGCVGSILIHANFAAYHLAATYSTITDVIIANNAISDSFGTGIELRSDFAMIDGLARVKIIGNVLRTILGRGITNSSSGTVPVYDVQVDGNTVSAVDKHGIYFGTASRVKVAGNVVFDCGRQNVETSGIYLTAVAGLMCVQNMAYETRTLTNRTQQTGISVINPTDAVLVDGNLAWNNVTAQYSHTGIPAAAALDAMHSAVPSVKPAVTGAKGSNAALASLITQLVAKGIITDSTTA